MPDTGYLQVRAYTSKAQYPLTDVAIVITASDGTAIAMATTDRTVGLLPFRFPFRIAAKVCPRIPENDPLPM